MCNSTGYNGTAPSALGRTPSQDNSVYEFREKASPDNMKVEVSTRTSRPESRSRFESPSRSEVITTSPAPPPSHRSEAHFFPWLPEEQIRNLRFEAAESPPKGPSPRISYLSYPTKLVYNRFQTAPTMASKYGESTPERQRRFTAPAKDLGHHERQETFQKEENHDLTSVHINASARKNNDNRKGTIREEVGPRSRVLSDGTEQSSSLQQNGSMQPDQKANSGHLNKKDEEPVWKTYQWYRDRKRPYSQQTKRQKSEPTIFMQYNEIRDKRFKEGKVVNDKRRSSEPWTLPSRGENDLPSSPSQQNSAPSLRPPREKTPQNGDNEQPGSPHSQSSTRGYPTKRRKLSRDSISPPLEKRHLTDGVRVEQDFMRSNGTGHHYMYNSSEGGLRHAYVDQNCNIRTNKTAQHVASYHNVEPRNDFELPVNNNEDSTAHEDDEISSTTYEDRVDVLPDTLRHFPQDVAKILRLNRIVKAVRNNRKGQQEVEGMKGWKVHSGDNRLENGDEGRMRSVERYETHVEYPSDSDQDIDRGTEHETTESSKKERNPNVNFIGVFGREGDLQQVKCGEVNSFEESPDFSGLTNSDQESFSARQMDARDENDPVCQVNGLLSLPGFKETKFNISLGELRRRTNPPETLTRVEMISYVRQAKSSGRVLLDRNNIVTANRSHPTILSRVCESEAQVLADGILKMNREYLPLAILARKTVDAYKDDGCKVENCEDCRLKLRRRIVDVEITRLV